MLAVRRRGRRAHDQADPAADLAGIDVPVALIWGHHDRVMKLQIAEAANARFGWPRHVIEDSGHASTWDQPDLFTETLQAVLTG